MDRKKVKTTKILSIIFSIFLIASVIVFDYVFIKCFQAKTPEYLKESYSDYLERYKLFKIGQIEMIIMVLPIINSPIVLVILSLVQLGKSNFYKMNVYQLISAYLSAPIFAMWVALSVDYGAKMVYFDYSIQLIPPIVLLSITFSLLVCEQILLLIFDRNNFSVVMIENKNLSISPIKTFSSKILVPFLPIYISFAYGIFLLSPSFNGLAQLYYHYYLVVFHRTVLDIFYVLAFVIVFIIYCLPLFLLLLSKVCLKIKAIVANKKDTINSKYKFTYQLCFGTFSSKSRYILLCSSVEIPNYNLASKKYFLRYLRDNRAKWIIVEKY